MLTVFTVLIILVVGYAQCREGLFAALALCVNVLLAGLLTFHFWEPLADQLDALFGGGGLSGFEDAFVLTFLFAAFLSVLRLATARWAPGPFQFTGYIQQIGGGLFGLLAGYLLAGFWSCVLQTLPWHENFLGFRPRLEAESAMRSYLPADRVWLALMRHAGAGPFAWKRSDPSADNIYDRFATFDADATFELRYLRYRRYGDNRHPLVYEGELDLELRKKKPR
jgi:hypothetical protein